MGVIWKIRILASTVCIQVTFYVRESFKKIPAAFGPQYELLMLYTLYSCKRVYSCVLSVLHEGKRCDGGIEGGDTEG